jgi:hypothetical protein
LLTVERVIAVAVKFKHTCDVRVHQADIRLPFGAQAFRGPGLPARYLERDCRARQPVFREPRLCLTTTAQMAFECVPFG